jgi:hypothetical protein
MRETSKNNKLQKTFTYNNSVPQKKRWLELSTKLSTPSIYIRHAK